MPFFICCSIINNPTLTYISFNCVFNRFSHQRMISGSKIGIQCNIYNDGDVTFDIAIVSSIDLIKWLEFGNEEVSN